MDQLIEKFDDWITQNLDIEKYANMTKAAKNALWKEFIEEIEVEDGKTEKTKDEPLLKQSPRV